MRNSLYLHQNQSQPKTIMARRTFEDALEKLEAITRELEDGQLGLEASLKKFDEGIKLADFCNNKLMESQRKVSLLLEKNGQLTETPFTSNSDEHES